MPRLRYNGTTEVQLPTPFGFIVRPGDVVEIPDNMLHILRAKNYSVFGAMPGGGTALPSFELWSDTTDEQAELAAADAAAEAAAPRKSRAKAADAGDVTTETAEQPAASTLLATTSTDDLAGA